MSAAAAVTLINYIPFGGKMPSPWSQDLYINAYKFAAKAHWNERCQQKVPGTDIPYLVHFSMVAMEVTAALAVESELDGDLAVQCALLHDTIEDTGVTLSELKDGFGKKVADGVLALTKDETVGADLPDKWERKNLQTHGSLQRIKSQSREIWMAHVQTTRYGDDPRRIQNQCNLLEDCRASLSLSQFDATMETFAQARFPEFSTVSPQIPVIFRTTHT